MTSAVSSMIVADRTKTLRTAAAVAFAFAIAAVPGAARADDAAKPQVRADALFKEGRQLLDQKKYDEACAKLSESQRLDPGAGTLLALALCHEGQGKTATAWAELDEAAKLGRKVGRQDLAAAAEKRARIMEPNLSKLIIRMPKDGPKQELVDLVVKVDGAKIPLEDFGAPFAIDSGEHKVEMSAKGKVPKAQSIRMSGAGTIEIVVDKLEDAPATAPAPAAEPVSQTTTRSAPVKIAPLTEPPVDGDSSPTRGSAQRTFGIVLGALGIGGLGAGGYFAAKAVSDGAAARCNGPCPAGASDANDRAKQSTTNAIIAFSSGTVALAAGTIIYLTAPDASSARAGAAPRRATARLVPEAGPQQVGLGVVGTF